MIAIASDHGGYDLKERVKKYLEEKNIPYQDMGCDSKASCYNFFFNILHYYSVFHSKVTFWVQWKTIRYRNSSRKKTIFITKSVSSAPPEIVHLIYFIGKQFPGTPFAPT